MRLIITGTPGTGKTAVAGQLAKTLSCRVINDGSFAEKNGIGKWNSKLKEREIPVFSLTKKLNSRLKKTPNIIVEGHLACECRLRPVDAVIVLACPQNQLLKRLKKRKYSKVKILDNLWAERESYCLKKALKNHPKTVVFRVNSAKTLKTVCQLILSKLKRLNAKMGNEL